MPRNLILKIILTGALLIAILALLNLTPLSKGIKNFFYLISAPLQQKFWQAGNGASDFFSGILAGRKYKTENEKLNLQIQQLLAENGFLSELKRENEFLREALNLGLEKQFELRLAEISGKNISQDAILINQGRKDGLSQNLPVISSQKVLIGKIGEVFQDFSKVILISNKDVSFDAKISGKEIYGIIRGRGNNKLNFEFMPQGQELKEGDLVMTTVLGGIFPGELLVGRIQEIEINDLEPFQKARVQSSFDIAATRNLFVVLSY